MATYEKILESKTQSSPFNIEVGGKTIAWVLRHSDNVKKQTKSICYPYKCRECLSRSRKFVLHEGKYGPMLFQGCDVSKENVLFRLRDLALKVCYKNNNIEPVIVTPDTYPPLEYTRAKDQSNTEIFKHFTF